MTIMTYNTEQFDLAPMIDDPMNMYKVIHLHNNSNVYHLTRQVLLDSLLTQETYCFFYHILSQGTDEFNSMYGSFACIVERNPNDSDISIEADLYLNVNCQALEYIIQYVQTGVVEDSYLDDHKNIVAPTIDLATVFGMSKLVASLRNYREENRRKYKSCLPLIPLYTDLFVKDETLKGHINDLVPILEKYINADTEADRKEIMNNDFQSALVPLLYYLFSLKSWDIFNSFSKSTETEANCETECHPQPTETVEPEVNTNNVNNELDNSMEEEHTFPSANDSGIDLEELKNIIYGDTSAAFNNDPTVAMTYLQKLLNNITPNVISKYRQDDHSETN